MLDHPLATGFLTGRQLVAPAGKRIVSGPQLDVHRVAHQGEGLAETVFQVSEIAVRDRFGLVAVNNDARRMRSDIGVATNLPVVIITGDRGILLGCQSSR